MNAVLDEGAPDDIIEPLRRLGASVDRFRPEWRGLTNGKLLAAIETAGYDLLITNDKNMGFQLSLRRLRISIVALPANHPDALLPRLDEIYATLAYAKAGQVLWIGMDGRRPFRALDSAGAMISDELPPLRPFWP